MKPANEPVFIIVAGPNGAGKSTLAKVQGIPVVDPDIEAARTRSNIAGGRATIERIHRMIGRKESFALETTLSGHNAFKAMRTAKAAGFHILLLYVGIESVDDCVERIKRRVDLGGHDVPATDVLRRFHRSLQNLPAAIELADKALLFDNTDPGEPRFVAAYDNAHFAECGDVSPSWFVRLPAR